MKILITSVGTVTSVNLIKYFKRYDESLIIVGVDINNYGYTSGSLLVDKYCKVPLSSNHNYLKELTNIIDLEKIDVLIPVHDNEVKVISENKKLIKCVCIIPDVEIINILRDKYICAKEIERIGLLIPKILSGNNYNFRTILRDKVGVGSKGIKYFEAKEHICSYDENTYFLQEYVFGEEYTVDCLCDINGKPIYIVPRKRLEVKSGIATKVEIIEDKILIEYAKKILTRFHLPGFSNIQFIKDGNNYYFIEVNYRFSGCGAATLATSKNYLKAFLNMAEKNNSNYELNSDVRWGAIVTRYYEEKIYEKSNS